MNKALTSENLGLHQVLTVQQKVAMALTRFLDSISCPVLSCPGVHIQFTPSCKPGLAQDGQSVIASTGSQTHTLLPGPVPPALQCSADA